MKQTIEKQYSRFRLNITIAFEALRANALRSLLSALGIIFGVAAVISMLAIGKGTEQEILEKMKEVGVNNIVIYPFVKSVANSADQNEANASSNTNGDSKDARPAPGGRKRNKYSPGLRLTDIAAIEAVLPNVVASSPFIEKACFATCNGRYADVSVKAVSRDFFSMFNLTLQEGSLFTTEQANTGTPVCVLTERAKYSLLGAQKAEGKQVKIGALWFTVVGVLKSTVKKEGANGDVAVYIPAESFLLRIEDRGKLSLGGRRSVRGKKKNQLDRAYIQVAETDNLLNSSKIIARLLERRHGGITDFSVEVPELLLKQQEETKSIFNIVLGVIAGISLLVGGIGIMNIMNASVLERTREIGVRMAIGANKADISVQFLSEAVLICLCGGVLGIIAGIVMSVLITQVTGIATVISLGAVCMAFFVTTAVGMFFGYYPAKKASVKDPIESLRYE